MSEDIPQPAAMDAPSQSAQVNGNDNRDKKRKRNDRGYGSKKKELGRNAWSRDATDRRGRVEESRNKNARTANPDNKSEDQDAGPKEDRRPKRKVAVMIGYSGTGYKGMQISPGLKTIEGDLFDAFVSAGAISKSNADDPKKSSLSRCARTDKGVHAACNMISIKLIVEDEDIVERINNHLSPQLRVWGIERTVGSFSCYQACDSRWYEYLIPSHAFLPPLPSTYLAKALETCADQASDREGYEVRQADVKGYWDEAEEKEIKPVLEGLDADIRGLVMEALYKNGNDGADVDDKRHEEQTVQAEIATSAFDTTTQEQSNPPTANQVNSGPANVDPSANTEPVPAAADPRRKSANEAIKSLRSIYESAKRRFRIPSTRISRIQDALDQYLGTHNFHNYTVNKTPRDPSAKRVIKSFKVSASPIYINGTEWLSIKIHGQSFMMHQIRKMISLITLLVRCGANLQKRIPQSFQDKKWIIPKAPGLGLLLERPVFDAYNKSTGAKNGRAELGFDKYADAIEKFKHAEIYQKIFQEEAKENTFHNFFHHVDNYPQPIFSYVTSAGLQDVEANKDAVDQSSDRAGAASGAENGLQLEQNKNLADANLANVKAKMEVDVKYEQDSEDEAGDDDG